jgi:hypothetical protein
VWEDVPGVAEHVRFPSFLIVGTPRSGTTLVQRLACEVDGVVVPPETHFFSLLAPALLRRRFPLDPLGVRAELERFAALSTSRGLDFDVAAAAARLPDGCGRPLDLFAAIVTQLAPGAALAGEKTPNHLLWWRPLARAAPALRWIVVVRDPRAVVASYRPAWGARDHVVLAQRWRADQREAMALLAAAGPRRALLLRYEDVVVAPGAVRDRLAAFLGAAAAPPAARAAPALALSWEHWKGSAAGPVDPGRRAAWRGVLSREEAATVAAIAGAVMARLGYRAPPRAERVARTAALPPADHRRRLRFRFRRRVKLVRNAWLGRRLARPERRSGAARRTAPARPQA